jgi:hypothetical protein
MTDRRGRSGRITTLAIAGICLALAACGGPRTDPFVCMPGLEVYQRTELFLGLSSPQGRVSPVKFQRFISVQVTPRWGTGFSILDGQGVWKGGQEPSKVLVRLHQGGPEENVNIEAIADAYKSQFSQDSVLRSDQAVCAKF